MSAQEVQQSREAFFEDLSKALYGLRVAFHKHGLEPPTSLEVGTRKDADRMMFSLPPEFARAKIEMRDGTEPAVFCNIQGFEIRFPAQRVAYPASGGGVDVRWE